jgi:hypothetical protein
MLCKSWGFGDFKLIAKKLKFIRIIFYLFLTYMFSDLHLGKVVYQVLVVPAPAQIKPIIGFRVFFLGSPSCWEQKID